MQSSTHLLASLIPASSFFERYMTRPTNKISAASSG